MHDDSKCLKCSHFGGTEQGDTVICIWDDVSPVSSRVLYPDEQENEFLAVSEYIEEGYLKKG